MFALLTKDPLTRVWEILAAVLPRIYRQVQTEQAVTLVEGFAEFRIGEALTVLYTALTPED